MFHCTANNDVKFISGSARRYRLWHWCLLQRWRSSLLDPPVCPQSSHKRLILGDHIKIIQGTEIPWTMRPNNTRPSISMNVDRSTYSYPSSCVAKSCCVTDSERSHDSIQESFVFPILWSHKLNTYFRNFHHLNVICTPCSTKKIVPFYVHNNPPSCRTNVWTPTPRCTDKKFMYFNYKEPRLKKILMYHF